MASLKITILADNYAYKLSNAEWGFSAFIEYDDRKYLFDTGNSGDCVVKNAELCNINLRNIDGIILSHGHYDHANGLEAVLKASGGKNIIAHPNIFDKKLSTRKSNKRFTGIKFTKEYLELTLNANFFFHSGFYQIYDNLYASGEVPLSNDYEKIPIHFKILQDDGSIKRDNFLDDNSFIINTKRGLIIVVGCAHRGVVNIMEYAKNKLGKDIYAILGGTHLMESNEEQFNYVVDYIKKQDITLIAPNHCTGMDKITRLKQIFPDRVKPAFCGETFHFYNI